MPDTFSQQLGSLQWYELFVPRCKPSLVTMFSSVGKVSKCRVWPLSSCVLRWPTCSSCWTIRYTPTSYSKGRYYFLTASVTVSLLFLFFAGFLSPVRGYLLPASKRFWRLPLRWIDSPILSVYSSVCECRTTHIHPCVEHVLVCVGRDGCTQISAARGFSTAAGTC